MMSKTDCLSFGMQVQGKVPLSAGCLRRDHRRPTKVRAGSDASHRGSGPPTKTGRQCLLLPRSSINGDAGRREVLWGVAFTAATLVQSSEFLSQQETAAAAPRNAESMAKLARLEPDPEIALELWGEVVDLDGGTAVSLYERGNVNLKLRMFGDAVRDLERAALLLRDVRSGEIAYLPTSQTVPVEVVREALALDGIGLAKGQLGDWEGARDAFQRALGTAGAGGASLTVVPQDVPSSGLRGGAATLGQRLELHAALAKLASGDTSAAVEELKAVDKGPNPNGFPQFWDARAALVVALSASGRVEEAELEWADLCRPTPPPPPATPSNPFFARVNKTAQGMLAAEGIMTDRNCEDYETGVFLPCDDAGIPGLGGSSSPCALYTAQEVAARLWPVPAVAELDVFRGRAAEESSAAMAKGIMQRRPPEDR